jgi:signal transduction histidine kinase
MKYGVRGNPRPLDPKLETVLFRVAQEAVTNVLKHAKARTIRVVLAYGHRSVRLSIADDGTGFVAHPDLGTYSGHWGLLGMRERASHVRGKLTVHSTPGAGTKIVLHVPIGALSSPIGVGDTLSAPANDAPTQLH